MDKAVKAKELLKKLQVARPIDKTAFETEASELSEKLQSMRTDLDSLNRKMKQLQNLRNCIRKVIPDAMPLNQPDGKDSFREIAETATNQKNLEHMMSRVTDQAIRQGKAPEIEATVTMKQERE